jgi:hypothetical protein
MPRAKWLIVTLLIQVLAIAGARSAAAGKEYVDLELELAVDVSSSMDNEEQRWQRDGYVAAFVIRALCGRSKAARTDASP